MPHPRRGAFATARAVGEQTVHCGAAGVADGERCGGCVRSSGRSAGEWHKPRVAVTGGLCFGAARRSDGR